MVTIGELDSMISVANKEINNCKDLLKLITSLSGNLTECIKYLNNVSNDLSNGLIINGEPVDSRNNPTIKGRANNLQNYKTNIESFVDPINNRIAELEGNIIYWQNKKNTLAVKLATLISGDGNKVEKI